MPSSCPTIRNRLATASSPYLRQHADNPVHWQPWDDDALAHAKETDTPILLSIGYSACHWCHVMAHECFENAAIAESMNAHFVNIKLDREERPDIDHVYQLAHQALSGRGGGWPLTVFLDPQDHTPFYIGTYFPSTPRHGLPGFPEVLTQVRNHFDTHRDELRVQSGELRNWLQHAETGPAGAGIDSDVVAATALRRISARFDPAWGGSRGAPKFPRAAELEWLLDQPEHDEAHKMAHLTLRRMAARGLQDHLGGGFFRYCVDANWTIPHFEKMLYDNAQLLPLYARVAADDDVDANLRDTARAAALGVSDWLAREMTTPDGTFYSSLDADSEGEEGRFYLWNREQVREALGDNNPSLAETAFGLDDEPNFEEQAWHLLYTVPIDELAERSGVTPAVAAEELAQAQQRLLETRARRERPARDDKILTAWNALAIAGLARSARLQGDARYADMALHALAALRKSAWIDGELFANSAKSASRISGFLDDHALVLDALLEVMQLTFDPRDLDWAIALADNLLAKFEDHDTGGFWFSTAQHATPLVRGRTFTDDALPNGNGVAIRSLLRLGHLLGRTDYLDAAGCALSAAAGTLASYPDACPTLLRALREREHPRMQIVIRCSPEQEVAWRTALQDSLRDAGKAPGDDTADAFLIPAGLDDLPYILAARNASGVEGTAWICEGLSCRAPITSLRELTDVLRSKKP